jgi:hypothetical protein
MRQYEVIVTNGQGETFLYMPYRTLKEARGAAKELNEEECRRGVWGYRVYDCLNECFIDELDPCLMWVWVYLNIAHLSREF